MAKKKPKPQRKPPAKPAEVKNPRVNWEVTAGIQSDPRGLRLDTVEQRMAAVEARLAAIERASTKTVSGNAIVSALKG